MVPSYFAVESAVRHFLHQWNCGLCPSLLLNTQDDGDIDIRVKLRVSSSNQQQQSEIAPRSCLQGSKRSGKASRIRRRNERKRLLDTEETIIESCSFENSAYQAPMDTQDDSTNYSKLPPPLIGNSDNNEDEDTTANNSPNEISNPSSKNEFILGLSPVQKELAVSTPEDPTKPLDAILKNSEPPTIPTPNSSSTAWQHFTLSDFNRILDQYNTRCLNVE